MMKTRTLLGSLIATCALAGTAAASLTWEKTDADLKPSISDKTAVAHFKYKNTGDKPVKITSVHASCGCTTAALAKDTVAPDESGEIVATFNIGDRTGVQTKTITVLTDDQPQQATVLKLKATIPQLLQISPTFVYWTADELLNPKTITVDVGPEYTVNQLTVTPTDKSITTEVVRDEEKKEFRIIVRPTEEGRPINASLKIEPDLPKDSGKSFYANLRVDARAKMPPK
ncbi:MAG: DUF1573 domain-containing protein [Chthoniobacterales bacterium]|nr:DUF1573 domain-containing protein [Chthoniobacterales bacterium]